MSVSYALCVPALLYSLISFYSTPRSLLSYGTYLYMSSLALIRLSSDFALIFLYKVSPEPVTHCPLACTFTHHLVWVRRFLISDGAEHHAMTRSDMARFLRGVRSLVLTRQGGLKVRGEVPEVDLTDIRCGNGT